jgi:hypothetical protein
MAMGVARFFSLSLSSTLLQLTPILLNFIYVVRINRTYTKPVPVTRIIYCQNKVLELLLSFDQLE